MNQKRKPQKMILGLLLLLLPIYSFAQDDLSRDANQVRPAYLGIAYGVHHTNFRDFATSPLWYVGNPFHLSLAHIDLDEKRKSSFQLSYSAGNFKDHSEQSDATSQVNIFAINYVELFQLPKLSHATFNVKVGGQFNSTAIIRDNPLLGNNGQGFEVISTVFGAVKGTIAVAKKESRIKSNLALGLNLGLLNSAYRNGFIYTRQSPLLNQDTITDGYQFHVFSGYRINSIIDYTIWLKNKNGVRLSYEWDAFRTGNEQNEFEMATHLLKLSLMFNLK